LTCNTFFRKSDFQLDYRDKNDDEPDLESDEIKQSLLQLCETTLMDELNETLIKDMT
jgi:hypothetical protein